MILGKSNKPKYQSIIKYHGEFHVFDSNNNILSGKLGVCHIVVCHIVV